MSERLIRVQLPRWWSEQFDDGTAYGYTDAVDTCCCSCQRCWYVEIELDPDESYFSDVPYEGYFAVADLIVVNEDNEPIPFTGVEIGNV